ncbi:MAG: hypothetical protein A2428_00920 [Bdellovibrionales bacterium RIFOXYC1_FULL_54_43]|nr:MAG: hypothetical protein A2428_00920 [Bdellovibrionales bacterium RIFOXYC1_FULL_54_43]OFZ82847.1 MAG: hypothetical protein A2603_11645 [Bdellovibrionales bacterium RIFOXYD1_FULL_55_31]
MKKIELEIAQAGAAIDLCRSTVLDAVELEMGDSPAWPPLRGRILRAFGDKGLTRRIIQILEEMGSNRGGVE